MKKEPLFIAFASQKGGVGKTAFTVLTAGILRYQRGYNVAVVDCDPPQHSIGLMRDRDLECVKENDSLKMALYRQYKQKPQKAYPIIKSEPENAVENFYRYMREQETEFDIVLFDLPCAFRYMGMIRTLALMHHIFIPLKADDAVMQSTLQFASVIRKELVSHEDYPLKGIHLFWNMIDKREDKGTFEAWNKTICDSKLHLMTTCSLPSLYSILYLLYGIGNIGVSYPTTLSTSEYETLYLKEYFLEKSLVPQSWEVNIDISHTTTNIANVFPHHVL